MSANHFEDTSFDPEFDANILDDPNSTEYLEISTRAKRAYDAGRRDGQFTHLSVPIEEQAYEPGYVFGPANDVYKETQMRKSQRVWLGAAIGGTIVGTTLSRLSFEAGEPRMGLAAGSVAVVSTAYLGMRGRRFYKNHTSAPASFPNTASEAQA